MAGSLFNGPFGGPPPPWASQMNMDAYNRQMMLIQQMAGMQNMYRSQDEMDHMRKAAQVCREEEPNKVLLLCR